MPPKRKRPPGGGAANLRRHGLKGMLVKLTPEQAEELKRAAGTFTDRRRYVSLFVVEAALALARRINAKENSE